VGELIGINAAAELLGVHRSALIALQSADLIPWHPTGELPAFDPAELEAIRPRLPELLGKVGQSGNAVTDSARDSGIPVAATLPHGAQRHGLVEAPNAKDDHAWEQLGPLLSSAQVCELLGVSRQRVDSLLRARRLIGLRDNAGRRRFPAFQFLDARPLSDLINAYWTVAASTVSDWTAAAWCTAPDEALGDLSPLQWARERRDSERLATVACQDAARLAQ
jgi:hypothetical protein